MSGPLASLRRGRCPGALAPMRTGDGLLVRLRLTGGRLAAPVAAAVADLARRHGNGALDLSARANLQIRGVGAETLAPVQAELARLGLLDAHPAAEAVRNVLVGPLAGLDPAALADGLAHAAALERCLAGTPALHALPPKFGWLIDDGGFCPMDDVTADVRFRAVSRDGEAAWAVGFETAEGIDWVGACARDALPAAAAALGEAFLALRPSSPEPARRMRQIPPALRARVAEAAGLAPLAAVPSRRAGALYPGVLALGDGCCAVGFGLAYGRIGSEALVALARLAAERGTGELRLTPWRLLLLPVPAGADVEAMLATGRDLGLVVDARDPRLAIAACPGAPACEQATTVTHADAGAIARAAAALFDGSVTLHVSGCGKGCARQRPATLVLTGEAGRYGLARNADATAAPLFRAPPAAIIAGFGRLAAQLAGGSGGTGAAEALRRIADRDIAALFGRERDD
ncbi:precorrin-3B synthase [Chelatococcus sp. SYSU_G07232]|uniref:Precorrin-3B synthase n=1 Tax=Chelatococcus albus TaxID=3047466 RepID=A0ABT7AHH5_9HYPH|nr:precorrin-3B synthase [Chelatococcus sp. SYSU_G07232]MDJ1158835.1 precorrin-3B synthase [Chelatococcus sp. SYSU_G07232]